MRITRRPLIAGLTGLAAALSGVAVATAPAEANPAGTDVVISEVYGAGGNSGAVYDADFVELYNPTDDPISLAGRYIHYRAANGNQGGNPVALSGEVPAHGHFLIQMGISGANGAALPGPDAGPFTFSMAAAGGQVFLLAGSSNPFPSGTNGDAADNPGIVDMVGAMGALTSETAPTTSAATTTLSLQRSATGADTDNNASDFTTAAPTPTSSEEGDAGLSVQDPGAQSATLGTPFSLQLTATGGTPPYEWQVSGLPAGLDADADGAISGTPTESGSFDVTAEVTDAADGSGSVSFTLTVSDPDAVLPIAEIQGTGSSSPLVGQTVTTEGVVTAVYPGAGSGLPGNGNFNGFYLQTPGEDTTPGASDAIFVFGPSFDESTLEIGDSVRVTGSVSEFGTLTELTASTVTEVADLGDVVPNTVIPGTDCALPGDTCPTLTELDALKEEFEGEVFQLTGDYTVTDAYDGSAANPPNSGSSNFFGEIGLAANSDSPLITPTEIIDAQDTAAIEARVRYNNAHRVVLDDGASTTHWNTSNTGQMDIPFPWFTPDHTVRVGAAVTFDQPVILDYRFGWKIQPVSRVIGDGTGLVNFEQDRPATPDDVGGDLRLATFNVLNYFTTLGEDLSGCQPYEDRDGNPIAVRTGCDARGAWNDASFQRQQAKIVNAINTIDADIVSVEEIENSLVVDGHDRDEALSALVDALNADAGADVWDYVHSPASASEPDNVAQQDVIRTGFIYKPATVDLVGEAAMLFDEPAFENAREPFAQVFKAAGADDEDGFAVIVNHFKSKGSGVDDGTGQGLANPDRIAQAEALSAFADDFAAERGVDAVFLTGDFNASSMEDPVQVLTGDGYVNQEEPGEYSYSFDGQSQSLDHVFANPTANAMVTGFDIWQINANETVFNQYSRYNYNATILYDEGPFSASDHNPEIVGIDVPDEDDTRVEATIAASHTPKKVKVGKANVKLRVDVSAEGVQPTGTLTVTVPGHAPLTATLDKHGRATIDLPAFDTVGDHVVEIAYSGDENVQGASVEYTIEVVR